MFDTFTYRPTQTYLDHDPATERRRALIAAREKEHREAKDAEDRETKRYLDRDRSRALDGLRSEVKWYGCGDRALVAVPFFSCSVPVRTDDGYRIERIHPHALDDYYERDIPLTVEHKQSLTVARTGDGSLCVTSTRAGLRVQFALYDNSAGRFVRNAISNGRCRAFSWLMDGCKWRESMRGNTSVRELIYGELVEITLTDTPSYQSTRF